MVFYLRKRDIVIHLQTALVALGFNIGYPKPDGILGNTTMEAVKKFQTSNTDFKSSQGSETHLLVLFAIVVYNGARHSVAERLSSVVLIIVKKI